MDKRKRFRINVFSNSIHIKPTYTSDICIIDDYCEPLIQYEVRYSKGRGNNSIPIKHFFVYYRRTEEFGLHGSHLDKFIKHLNNYSIGNDYIDIIKHPRYEPLTCNPVIRDEIKPMEHQVNVIPFLDNNELVTILLLQMGKGKTFCTLYSIAKKQKRAMIILRACDVDTWVKDAKKIYTNSEEVVHVVKGGSGLKDIIKEGKSLKPGIILVTINVFRAYIAEFERKGFSNYGCDPIEIFEHLGVDLKVIDECHTNLHFNFRLEINTNCNRSLYLTATMKSHIPFINRMYKCIYPVNRRYTGLDWDRYVDVASIEYGINDRDNIVTTNNNGMYSHTSYEQWILGDRRRYENYSELILVLVKKTYLATKKPGDKLLIFMSCVNMCNAVANYLNRYLDDVSISDYTGKHDVETLHSNDIVVTTPGSTGTGKNVDNVMVIISTVAVHSKELNIQMLGRIRKPIDDRHPKFLYLTCTDIPKHMGYHRSRVITFRGLVSSQRIVDSRWRV